MSRNYDEGTEGEGQLRSLVSGLARARASEAPNQLGLAGRPFLWLASLPMCSLVGEHLVQRERHASCRAECVRPAKGQRTCIAHSWTRREVATGLVAYEKVAKSQATQQSNQRLFKVQAQVAEPQPRVERG